MKLTTPLYEGDSIIRRGPTPAETTVSGGDTTPKFVQRSDPSKQEIGARARAERAAAVALYAKRVWGWLAAYLDRARRGHEEAYLARAQSLTELERRMRDLERSSLTRV